VESNQHGLTTLKYLQASKYFPIYYERSPKYKKSKPTDVLGFRTSQSSKPLIIDNLAEALRSGLEMPDELTMAELKTFTRDDKAKMSGSPYDDRTMSLAIANYMRKFVFFAEFTPDKNPPAGSFGDWERRLYGDSFQDLLESSHRGGETVGEAAGAAQDRPVRGQEPDTFRLKDVQSGVTSVTMGAIRRRIPHGNQNPGQEPHAEADAGSMTFDAFDDSVTYTGGNPPRADKRGFPLYEGVDTTRVAVTQVDTTP
jgi:hypothetical protein